MRKGEKVRKNGFQTGNVILISIAHMTHDVYTSFLAPILPLLIQKLNISLFLSGMLAVVQRVPSLFNPFVGILAENLRVRYFVIFAPAATTLAMSFIGLAPTYTILLILIFVSGVSSTLFHVPAPVMVKKISGVRTGMGMSYYMMGGELARTLGPLVVVAAVEQWGLGGTSRLIPFGLVASFILWLKLRRISISEEVRTGNTNYLGIFRRFLPVFATLAGITFFRGAMKSSLTLYLPVYLTGKGMDLWGAGISLSLLQLAAAAGTFLSGSISDRIGRRTTLVIVTVLSPLLMLLFIKSSGAMSIILLLFMGVFLVGPESVNLAVIHSLDTKHLPFVNGIYMTINFFINSIMTLGVGALSDYIGMDKTYFIAAILAFPSIIFALMVPERKYDGTNNH
ncbi:MAG: MFS transporter [Bacteroidales bacterium]|nr:MFS transporter [Bacteroidales bacterium]